MQGLNWAPMGYILFGVTFLLLIYSMYKGTRAVWNQNHGLDVERDWLSQKYLRLSSHTRNLMLFYIAFLELLLVVFFLPGLLIDYGGTISQLISNWYLFVIALVIGGWIALSVSGSDTNTEDEDDLENREPLSKKDGSS